MNFNKKTQWLRICLDQSWKKYIFELSQLKSKHKLDDLPLLFEQTFVPKHIWHLVVWFCLSIFLLSNVAIPFYCSAQNWKFAAKQFLKRYPKDTIVHCKYAQTQLWLLPFVSVVFFDYLSSIIVLMCGTSLKQCIVDERFSVFY